MAKWWQERVIYQIYPRSFYDSNGDGIGDINGIILKLDYLKELGVGLLWLSPVYDSPQADNGYDISDYYNIYPPFGTMTDMERLILEAEKRDIKLVMDLVINHTSHQHEWFQKSRAGIEPYKDYYIWREGQAHKKPNNWTSFFAEDCWEYDEMRQAYYLHLFAKEQPDLNYQNPKVIEEVKKIMTFWLDKGIAGFRCDVINVIYKKTLNNGKKKLILTGSENYLFQEGTHRILNEINRDVLSQYDCFTVGETVFVTPEEGKKLCDESRHELDMIFSFEHMEADQWMVKWFHRKLNRKKFFETISKWQNAMEWSANYLENHDQRRLVSRFGNDKVYREASAKALATLLLCLKGSPFIYQGQEIGMTNFDFRDMSQIQDVESRHVNAFLEKWHLPYSLRWKIIKEGSRDNCRTPMQWSNSAYAGFSSSQPWLGVNQNYKTINVEAAMKDEESIWHYYRRLIELRKTSPVLIDGDFNALLITDNVFVFERVNDNQKWLIMINLSSFSRHLPYSGRLILSTEKRHLFDGQIGPYEADIIEVDK